MTWLLIRSFIRSFARFGRHRDILLQTGICFCICHCHCPIAFAFSFGFAFVCDVNVCMRAYYFDYFPFRLIRIRMRMWMRMRMRLFSLYHLIFLFYCHLIAYFVLPFCFNWIFLYAISTLEYLNHLNQFYLFFVGWFRLDLNVLWLYKQTHTHTATYTPISNQFPYIFFFLSLENGHKKARAPISCL